MKCVMIPSLVTLYKLWLSHYDINPQTSPHTESEASRYEAEEAALAPTGASSLHDTARLLA